MLAGMQSILRILGILGALAAALTIYGCGGGLPRTNPAPQPGATQPAADGVRPDSGPWFVEIDGEQAISKIASDRAGGEWFEDDGALVRLDESTRQFHRFQTSVTAASSPLEPNQAATSMWFAAPALDRIGRIDLSTHVIHVGKLTAGTEALGLAPGSGDSMWFTEAGRDRLGRIDPDTHTIYGYPIGFSPYDVAVGSDGKLWVTTTTGKLVRFDPVTHRKTTLHVDCTHETYIIAGPDGNVWFICIAYGVGSVARVDISSHAVSYFSLEGTAIDLVGRGSEIWVTGSSANGSYVAQFLPSAGEFVPYFAPAAAKLEYIATGADGELWATDFGDRLWRICPDLGQKMCAQN
jgi:virginiamycin B lyase